MNKNNQKKRPVPLTAKKRELNLTCTLGDMISRVKNEPKMTMVFSGIKQNSVGFIFGPSKSGKTIYCENLGMSIAAGVDSYLGLPINIDNKKVLFISLEEFYEGRTERNEAQLNKLSEDEKDLCRKNYIVVNEDMPRYLSSKEDWKLIKELLQMHKPGIVFIDSLSRLYNGSIEDSKVAKEVMKELRELCDQSKVTLVIIHHTPKLGNAPLTIHTLAGSRIIGQDADFGIGVNKAPNGTRYIKDVFFRYAPENDDDVLIFEIDKSNIWLTPKGREIESKLLSTEDGRLDNTNSSKILKMFQTNEESITTAQLEEKFVDTRQMSRATMFNALKKLERNVAILNDGHGKYKKVA